MTDTTTPTLAELIRLAVANDRLGLRTWLPGRIVSYDASTQRAEVELQLRQPVPTTSGGRTWETLPHLFDVPIGHPRGGGYFVHFPMVAGDFVSVAFSVQSLGEYLRTGNLSEPADPRLHGFFPYAIPTSDPAEPRKLDAQPAGKLVIGREGGDVLVLDEDGLKVGAENAAEPFVLGDALKTWLEALTVPTAMGPSGTPINAPSLDTILSTKHTIDE